MHNGFSGGRTVPLHDRLANAEQKSSPLRVVVVAAANSRQNVRHSGGFQTGGRQPRGYLVQRGFGRAFNGLEQDVAVKYMLRIYRLILKFNISLIKSK